ncbi:MAG: glucoamylase family protein [Candidatus Cyclobacteriaceae bacterium M3_2C_046]
MKKVLEAFFFLILGFNFSCQQEEESIKPDPEFQILAIRVGPHDLSGPDLRSDIPVDEPLMIKFNREINPSSVHGNLVLKDQTDQPTPLTINYLDKNQTISARPGSELKLNTAYTLSIGDLKSEAGALFAGASFSFETTRGKLQLLSLLIDQHEVPSHSRVKNVSLTPVIKANFDYPLDQAVLENETIRLYGPGQPQLSLSLANRGKTLLVQPNQALKDFSRFTFTIDPQLTSEQGRIFEGLEQRFYTKLDSTPDFEILPEQELLTKVQAQTFKYFWDLAHPASGMALERNTSGATVTSGGSGFGLMAIIVGIERGFITRQQGLDRLDKVLTFLESADRFHGAWSHWMDGTTGQVIPFSSMDNGGDLVETGFLIQGLLTFRQYLDPELAVEMNLIGRINQLWQAVEWDWYTRNGEKVLYWHWSPDFTWEMNHHIRGWNEALIVYILAAGAPEHTINPKVYHQGWAKNGAIINGNTFYQTRLPLGPNWGGPLFFEHYSFLGLDPRQLSDQYANYWQQAVNHSLINWKYCTDNPLDYIGYTASSWGLTASDNHMGYSAHSPTNDLGVITPTAALSSLPYTPEQSFAALNTFYYYLGHRLWGPYGFYDAFNPTVGWYADSYLAIDQGPIIVMIENYRTGLIWDLLMSAPEVKAGLDKLGFNY